MAEPTVINNDNLINLLWAVLAGQGVSVFAIFGLILKGNRLWTRLIDRADNMWAEYCADHKIPFVPLKGGKD